MDSNKTKKNPRKISRNKALALLGIAMAAAYVVPTLTPLGSAHASGGGIFGGGGSGGGSGGGKGGGGLSSFGSGGRGNFIINDKVTATECAECHMAYGAEALPQGSWKLIMDDLSNHFGEDASLDEATRKHVEDYLLANSPRGTGPLRISETRWFVSEHRGEVSPRKLAAAKSWSNCESCH